MRISVISLAALALAQRWAEAVAPVKALLMGSSKGGLNWWWPSQLAPLNAATRNKGHDPDSNDKKILLLLVEVMFDGALI